MISTIARKHDLIELAHEHRHAQIYVADAQNYVKGFLHEPGHVSAYGGTEIEPIVDPEGLYPIDKAQAWLTVNRYNALVLNTRNMLIADIDFGDRRLNRFAGAEDCDEVVANLAELHLLDEEHMEGSNFAFADQSYIVYCTHSGCRVICISVCVPWDEKGWAAERFMRFLGTDPEYIQLCGIQKCYRARLTPKPWRSNGNCCHVCGFEGKHGGGDVHADLEEQLRLHDELTLRENHEESFLA
jgi:hypothetical protein